MPAITFPMRPSCAALKLGLIAAVTAIQIHLSLTPQHTLLSSSLAFASLTAVINTRRNRLYGIIAVVLFLLSLEYRFKAAFIPFIICLPLLCLYFLKYKQLRKTYATILIALTCVTALSYLFSRHGYSDGEWRDFREYNGARGYLADNRLAQFHATTMHNTEDSIAYELFYRYRIFDKNILTKEKILSYKHFYEKNVIDSIRFNKNEYTGYFCANGFIFSAVILFFSLLWSVTHRRKASTLTILGSTILFIMCVIQMASTSFPKERVLLCSMVSVLLVALESNRKDLRFFIPATLATCLYFTWFYSSRVYDDYIRTTSPHEDVAEVESMLNKYEEGRVMLPVPTALVPEAFNTHGSPIGKKGIIQGWLHIYPLAPKKYQKFTVFTETGMPLLTKKSATEQIPIIQQLLLLHYKQQTLVDTLEESPNYLLLRIRKTGN